MLFYLQIDAIQSHNFSKHHPIVWYSWENLIHRLFNRSTSGKNLCISCKYCWDEFNNWQYLQNNWSRLWINGTCSCSMYTMHLYIQGNCLCLDNSSFCHQISDILPRNFCIKVSHMFHSFESLVHILYLHLILYNLWCNRHKFNRHMLRIFRYCFRNKFLSL